MSLQISSLYPVCPGSGEYVMGAHLFRNVKLNLENGKSVAISAPANSDVNRYIGKMKLNGNDYNRNFLTHSDLMKRASIECEMTSSPNKTRGVGEESRPYSYSREMK